jgi:hypothetical protein
LQRQIWRLNLDSDRQIRLPFTLGIPFICIIGLGLSGFVFAGCRFYETLWGGSRI